MQMELLVVVKAVAAVLLLAASSAVLYTAWLIGTEDEARGIAPPAPAPRLSPALTRTHLDRAA